MMAANKPPSSKTPPTARSKRPSEVWYVSRRFRSFSKAARPFGRLLGRWQLSFSVTNGFASHLREGCNQPVAGGVLISGGNSRGKPSNKEIWSMTNTSRVSYLLSAIVVSSGLALAPAAFAQDKMTKDSMSHDTMSKDAMKKDDAMSHDAMKKDDAMAKDSMAKNDAKKDEMKK
jgi:pentapeptide MXKDX repeat protein